MAVVNHAGLQIADCDDNAVNQEFVSPAGGEGLLRWSWSNGDMCVDAPIGNVGEAEVKTCDGGSQTQQWALANGQISLLPDEEKCLAVFEGSRIELSNCDPNDPNQKFTFPDETRPSTSPSPTPMTSPSTLPPNPTPTVTLTTLTSPSTSPSPTPMTSPSTPPPNPTPTVTLTTFTSQANPCSLTSPGAVATSADTDVTKAEETLAELERKAREAEAARAAMEQQVLATKRAAAQAKLAAAKKASAEAAKAAQEAAERAKAQSAVTQLQTQASVTQPQATYTKYTCGGHACPAGMTPMPANTECPGGICNPSICCKAAALVAPVATDSDPCGTTSASPENVVCGGHACPGGLTPVDNMTPCPGGVCTVEICCK